jgi:hypothetical protein
MLHWQRIRSLINALFLVGERKAQPVSFDHTAQYIARLLKHHLALDLASRVVESRLGASQYSHFILHTHTRTMPPFQKAILLVNAGARALKSGAALDALYLIRQGIVAMKDKVPLDNSGMSSPSCQAMPNAVLSTEASSNIFDCDGRYFVYIRPLEFPTEGCRSSCRREFERVRQSLSLYAVFNLALACQQLGIASGASAPLQRAMELYYSLLDSPFDSLVDNKTTINYSLLHCLVLNNLTFIHRERMEFDESQDCAEWMVDTWENTSCLEDCSGYLSEREAEEIKVNGMFLQHPSTAQAA